MVRYLDNHTGTLDDIERDRLLFWFLEAGMWGRFSGSTETYIDQDLAALEGPDGGLDKLIEQLRLWHGRLKVEPGHFTGWSLGARFYPVLYMLTRMGEAKDWGTGLPLKSGLLGRGSKLEVHHIFPKAQLYRHGYQKAEVNALANFCFLTKETNIKISDQLPEHYLPEVEKNHPGALESQWIPMDRELWKIENFREFLEARKILLAEAVNQKMLGLLHGDGRWLKGPQIEVREEEPVLGGFSSEEEEQELKDLNAWITEKGLPAGILAYDYSDPETGVQKAVFDLAWPNGMQQGLSEPVVVLLNEPPEVIALASQAGFRCFTTIDEFKQYVLFKILAEEKVA